MNTRKLIFTLLTAFFVSYPLALPAQTTQDEEETALAAMEARRAEYEALIEEAELKRQLAMEQANEAERVARRAQEAAVEVLQEEETEANKARLRERARQAEEVERMREELSRTHRELRETSRQVAQAHRDLVSSVKPVHRVRHINLGDRAVIGVILGQQTDDGIEIVGVSPDGPAEQAGLQAGDVLVSIGGVDLSGNNSESNRKTMYDVMDEVSDGEELALTVLRDNSIRDFTVRAETREPLAWQSLIRIPDTPEDVGEVGSSTKIIKRIVVPEMDREALAAEVAELEKQVEDMKFSFIDMGEFQKMTEGDWEFEFDDMSDFGLHALREADIWFGLPQALGLELAAINPELGDYFDTDRGVLVIRAKPDNAYTLQSGDVVLEIDATAVETPADLMRALRELNSGDTVEILIKRDRRDVTLQVAVPEDRLSLLSHHKAHR